jgi:hypothetical protein
MKRVPEISVERLDELFSFIKPVVRKGDDLFYIAPPELQEASFLWDPVVTAQATNLQEVGRIVTYHRYGYYGMFKPSIAEVLSQIPEHFIRGTLAFETVGPETTDDLNKNIDIVNEGYHVAETILYSVT